LNPKIRNIFFRDLFAELSGQIFWVELIVMSVEQRDFEENLENLATLQRLELLLKFAAKNRGKFCLVFSRILKGTPSSDTQELPREVHSAEMNRSKSLSRSRAQFETVLDFLMAFFSDQNSRKLDALRPDLAVAHKSAPISSDVEQGE
jgi:hypothetical protein